MEQTAPGGGGLDDLKIGTEIFGAFHVWSEGGTL
jgi:hypothetical protein